MLYLHQQCVMISISLLVNKGWIFSNVYFFVRHIIDKLYLFFKICIFLTNNEFEHFFMLIVHLHFLFYEQAIYIMITCLFSPVGYLSCVHATLRLKWLMRESGLQPDLALPGREFLH